MSQRFNSEDYVTVDERIDKFWAMYPVPQGSIQTEVAWVLENGNAVAVKATVLIEGVTVATGLAHEERGNGGANKTSWWENAETSAIGRALANLGMSLSKQRASREEMQKVQRADSAQDTPQPAPTQLQPAQRAQQAPQPFNADQFMEVIDTARAMRVGGDDYPVIVAYFAANRARMTPDQYEDCKEELRKIKAYTPEGAQTR